MRHCLLLSLKSPHNACFDFSDQWKYYGLIPIYIFQYSLSVHKYYNHLCFQDLIHFKYVHSIDFNENVKTDN